MTQEAARFVVYDLFVGDAAPRWIHHENSPDMRLEKYRFIRLADGQVRFELQEGWHAGSHYDGGMMQRILPAEWFSLSWDGFLARFAEKYPASECYYSAEELRAIPGLREFLGLAP